jgi:ribosomal-protein-alanine N-acetyltransferase
MTILQRRPAQTILRATPLSEHHVRQLQQWHYAQPYERYNFSDDPFERQWLCHPKNGYWQFMDADDALFGFAVIGKHAQTAGITYGNSPAIDLLIGLRPDLIGQHHGYDLALGACQHAHQLNPHAYIRVSVPAAHRAALHVWQQLGLFPEYAGLAADGAPHIVLLEQSNLYDNAPASGTAQV